MHTCTTFPIYRNTIRSGFTLLEMAIVLIIIGLLIGGVVTAQSLIRGSEINSIASDVQRYRAAFFNFRHKYTYLPGDLPTASSYWPSADCAAGLALTPPSTGCNGNGNGFIAVYKGVSGAQLIEGYRAWQHLALAGMIAGSFSGKPGPDSSGDDVIGINVPKTKINGVGIAMDYTGDYTADTQWYNGFYPTGFRIGQDSSVTGDAIGEVRSAFLIPEDAHSMDIKYDDGIPSTGKWRTSANNSLCVSNTGGNSVAVATYRLTTTTIACNMRVDLD